jgi:Phytanoyl-CoA dioxygenase (PhyH)
MELVLGGFNSNHGLSVEEYVMKAVDGMGPGDRLETALELIGLGLEHDERLQEVVAETWKLILREEWWKARYTSVIEFMTECGMSESVKAIMEGRLQTERLKRKFEYSAASQWGGRELKEVLGDELVPNHLSKGFLEAVKALARQVEDVEEARELLASVRDRRLEVRGVSNDSKLRVGDVRAAMQEARARPPKRSQITAVDEEELAMHSQISFGEVRGCSEVQVTEDVEESNSGNVSDGSEESETIEEALLDERGKICRCKGKDVKALVRVTLEGFRGKDLGDKVAALEGFDAGTWKRICWRHIKLIGSGLELQTSNLDRRNMIERVDAVWNGRNNVDELVRSDQTYRWFRKAGRPAHKDDGLGPFRFRAFKEVGGRGFGFDDSVIWKRFAGEGGKERFESDGNVVVSGLFDWIVKDEELMGMVSVEFEMYRHHLREQDGKGNLGWCRNMWHSLVQQVIRQDQAFYGLNVAARRDKNWRLVSFPYYTRHAMVGDSTAFKHVDLNIRRFLETGRGRNMVQTAVSMDDEDAEGCTIIVPGFHKHVREWWEGVVKGGGNKDGLVHGVGHIYRREEEERFGRFVSVVCRRGDVRMTLPEILHGSTGCKRLRRVVYPWLMGLDEEGKLELAECGTVESVASAHAKMQPVQRAPAGQGHHFSVGGRFEGAVEIRGVTAVGDALMGARRWDSGAVLMERNVILGGDEEAAHGLIAIGREKMKKAWKEGFELMVKSEMCAFGEDSYFRCYRLEGLELLASAIEVEGGLEMNE